MGFLLEKCGPIDSVSMDLGDLTILVGPQATGKSIALQMLKLAEEYPAIKRTMVDYAFNPSRSRAGFVSDYFGEGMAPIWTEKTRIAIEGKDLLYSTIKGSNIKGKEHSVFYIPAQRVLTFDNGWPKRFLQYDASVPFVVREFSEALFTYLDKAYASDSSGMIFPHRKSLRAVLKESLDESVYRGYSVVISTHSPAILEIVWALRMLKGGNDPIDGFCRIFGQTKKKDMLDMAKSVLEKSVKVHFFKPTPTGTRSIDISGMSPSGVDDEADWGGLTEQSSLISEIVAERGGEYES
jgi:hypothetical protein